MLESRGESFKDSAKNNVCVIENTKTERTVESRVMQAALRCVNVVRAERGMGKFRNENVVMLGEWVGREGEEVCDRG